MSGKYGILRAMKTCECGCGTPVDGETRWGPRRFVSGHNFRVQDREKSPEHRAAIAEGQRRAWRTKRQRLPVGTTRTNVHGYTTVKMVEGKGPWALEHVLVMEEVLGRKIAKGEIVHHINGDRQDNRPENLFLCRDHSHHAEVHRSQDEALRVMLAQGAVVFRDGRYEAVLRGT